MKRFELLIFLSLQIGISSVYAILIRFFLDQGHDSLNFIYQVVLSASVYLAIFGFVKEKSDFFKVNKSTFLKLFFIGIFSGGIAYAASYTGVGLSTRVNFAFLDKTGILTVLVLSAIFLKERLTKFKFFVIAIILIGVYLVSTGGQVLVPQPGDVLIIAGTTSYAVGIIISKAVLGDISAVKLSFFRSLVGGLSILLFIILANKFNNQFYWAGALFMGLVSAVSITAKNRVLKLTNASYMSIMDTIVPVFTILISVLLFEEERQTLTIEKLIGGILILFAITILNFKKLRKSSFS